MRKVKGTDVAKRWSLFKISFYYVAYWKYTNREEYSVITDEILDMLFQ